MIFKRNEIDLNEAHRAIDAHHLRLEGTAWAATGNDPYVVYSLSDHLFVGSWFLDLLIEPLEGKLEPRVYIHGGKGFSQPLSQKMRQIAHTRYKLAVHTLGRPRRLRLDPAESACKFRIVAFQARPIPFKTFLARALRNGEEKTRYTRPRLARLWPLTKRLLEHRVAFEVAPASTDEIDQNVSYMRWMRTFDYLPTEREQIRLRIASLRVRPLISVLMPVYNTPAHLLDAAIKSVAEQIYPNWELCIADDASTLESVKHTLERWRAKDSRIKVVYRAVNGHIAEATNSAFALASGDWLALLDHDDLLRENALAEIAIKLEERPDARVIYTDEDKIGIDDSRYDPHFKCDWNYDLFTAQNFLNHLTVIRAEDVRAVGGWRRGFEGSQDYDLLLRIIEKIDHSTIVHIPKVLYHWRAAEGSTAREVSEKGYAYKAAIAALTEHAKRIKIRATAVPINGVPYYRLKREVTSDSPFVSLIIPTKDNSEVLRTCIDSIVEKTTYAHYELIIVDNDSQEPATFAYFESIVGRKNIRIIPYPHPFNFSAINNFAVKEAQGSIIGLINNDVEVITPEWLTEMVSHAERPEIGCVGAKLYYPNNTIQHGGIILGIGGVAGHSHKYFKRSDPGYFGRLAVLQQVSAVTAACLVVRKSVYLEAGGLDEANLSVAFNDVDFCLRVLELGYRNLWTPFAELYHHESISRGADTDSAKAGRFRNEVLYMKSKWEKVLESDPCYSPHLSLTREDFSIGI